MNVWKKSIFLLGSRLLQGVLFVAFRQLAQCCISVKRTDNNKRFLGGYYSTIQKRLFVFFPHLDIVVNIFNNIKNLDCVGVWLKCSIKQFSINQYRESPCSRLQAKCANNRNSSRKRNSFALLFKLRKSFYVVLSFEFLMAVARLFFFIYGFRLSSLLLFFTSHEFHGSQIATRKVAIVYRF